MKLTIQVKIDDQDNNAITKDVTLIERDGLSIETFGLTLSESKEITSNIQKFMVERQITDYLSSERNCPCCGKILYIKGYNSLVYRTLFGKLSLKSPRLYKCKCSIEKEITFSPLVKVLSNRTSPELQYMQSKWASMMS